MIIDGQRLNFGVGEALHLAVHDGVLTPAVAIGGHGMHEIAHRLAGDRGKIRRLGDAGLAVTTRAGRPSRGQRIHIDQRRACGVAAGQHERRQRDECRTWRQGVCPWVAR